MLRGFDGGTYVTIAMTLLLPVRHVSTRGCAFKRSRRASFFRGFSVKLKTIIGTRGYEMSEREDSTRKDPPHRAQEERGRPRRPSSSGHRRDDRNEHRHDPRDDYRRTEVEGYDRRDQRRDDHHDGRRDDRWSHGYRSKDDDYRATASREDHDRRYRDDRRSTHEPPPYDRDARRREHDDASRGLRNETSVPYIKERYTRSHEIASREENEPAKKSALDLPLHPMLADLFGEPATPATEKKEDSKKRRQKRIIVEESLAPSKPNPYFQPELLAKNAMQTRRSALRFHQKGKFASRAELDRQEASYEALIREIAKSSEQAGIGVEELLRPAPREEGSGVVHAEWWDAAFLPDGIEGRVDDSRINHLVCMPPTFESVAHKPAAPKPLPPTPAERRKARRERRLAGQRDHQDMVRAGLLPPDPDRIKLSSLPTLLAASVNDPTSLEARVRAEVDARHRKHASANKERQLTEEERSAKRKAKLRAEGYSAPDGRVHAAVYRLASSIDTAGQFKIVSNARQLYLTGLLAIHSSFSAVIVEGGPKPLRCMRHLLLDRMPKLGGECLWEGAVAGHSFCRFDHLRVETEFEVRNLLVHAEKRGMRVSATQTGRDVCTPALADVDHYWLILHRQQQQQ